MMSISEGVLRIVGLWLLRCRRTIANALDIACSKDWIWTRCEIDVALATQECGPLEG